MSVARSRTLLSKRCRRADGRLAKVVKKLPGSKPASDPKARCPAGVRWTTVRRLSC